MPQKHLKEKTGTVFKVDVKLILLIPEKRNLRWHTKAEVRFLQKKRNTGKRIRRLPILKNKSK